MHGEWGPKEFRLALMGGLLFTSQQSKVIQAEARRRMSLQTGTLKEHGDLGGIIAAVFEFKKEIPAYKIQARRKTQCR